MGVKILGVDVPLDSQAEAPLESDVDIPGQYRRGGFYKPGGVPSFVEPTTGAQGTSLSTIPKGAYVNPSTGQPEMLTGPNGIAEQTRGGFNPLAMLAGLNPWARAGIAGAEITRATPAQGPGLTPAQMAHGPSDPADLLPKPTAYPQDYPVSRLLDSSAAQRGMPWPDTGVAPVQRGMPWPDTGVAPAPVARVGGDPRVTPSAAGPAAAVQQPNLGNYGASPFTTLDYRPNSGPNERNRGSPQATALDLSRLFGGGAPAVNPNVPAAAAQPVSSPVAPSSGMSRAPGTMGPLQKGAVWPKEMGPKKRPKSSSTSQGGNY